MYIRRRKFPVVRFLFFVVFVLIIVELTFNSYFTRKKSTISKAAVIQPSATLPKHTLDSTTLAKYMSTESVLLGTVDNMSYYFKDQLSNTTITQDPERSWIPASTIKAFVVLEAFRQRHLGLISFDHVITITANNVVPTAMESDKFPSLTDGTQVTIKQLVESMIIQSDNTAFNTLLDVLDRKNINSTLKNYQLTETVVGEKLSLDDNQTAIDQTVPGWQPDTTTAKDLATFFDLLYNKKIPDADEILAIFKQQKFNDMIPALIPPNTVVAHKTGEWDPYYHDGGIIYKTDAPFIFTAFSNSGTPDVVAQISRVAYFQSSDSVGVGKKLSTLENSKKILGTSSKRPIYYLSEIPKPSDVLGISSKFPPITAQDLGITNSDFGINPQFSQMIQGALITRGSPLYGMKLLFELAQILAAKTNLEKVDVYLNITYDRIAEAKTFLSNGDLNQAQGLLNETEVFLKQIASLDGNRSNSPHAVEIKQLSDLRFSLLSDASQNITTSQKQQFINNVYTFYKTYKTDLAPYARFPTITNPTQQKPIVAAVVSIKGHVATLKLSNGLIKHMVMSDATPLRIFQRKTYQKATDIVSGTQIAVVGTVSGDTVIPQFILNKVPKELPQAHVGIVTKIDPNTNELTILNAQGKEEVSQINQKTLLKTKDTNVSLEGIKVGSQVSIFGVRQPSTPTLTPTSIISISPVISPRVETSLVPSISNIIKGHSNSQVFPTSSVTSTTPSISTGKSLTSVIQATSVTVVVNSSGAKKTTKSPSLKVEPERQKQPESKPQPKSAPPVAAPTVGSKK